MAMQDDPIKVLLFLAQGFEDLEAVAILDVFAWTHYREHIQKVSVTTAGFHETVTSWCGLSIRPDIQFPEITPKEYQALVLPGGFHNQGFDEAYSSQIHRLAREIHQNGGYIATMCVGILPIADAGLLKGKKATTYPYSRNHDNVRRLQEGGAIAINKHVVIDDRIISCDGPGSSLDVAFLLMECLMGSETTQDVRRFMIYKNE
jgi:4-methyl-5(b-hydroxyethyl)-thiazole monophosphate biosynthesis